MLKTEALLNSEYDPNDFCSDIFDKYQNRPDDLNDICLYEFAQKWKITPKNLRNDDEEFDDNDELEDNFFDENGSVNEKKLNLKNSRITLYQRKRPAVVKTPYFSFTENSDEFSFQAR